MMSHKSYIVDGCRTAIGKFRGSLSSVRADDLAAKPIKALMDKYDFLRTNVDEVILGCANQAGEDNRNVARMALLLAGMDQSVPAETINRLCASGMSAVVHAKRSIEVGDADLIIAGGIEHMTRAPYVISKSARPFGSDAEMFDSSFGWRFINPMMEKLYGVEAMGQTAENLAELFGISREDQDTFAMNSQKKASAAQSAGRFVLEIAPVEILGQKREISIFDQDEFLRPDTNMEALRGLKPAFRTIGGTVTAGNASGLNDGAAALLVTSAKALKTYNLQPLVKIVSNAAVGVAPKIMGTGPIEASKKALQKAGLSLSQMNVIEINEAFAVQVLSCTRALGLADDDSRINPNGGAIALGHPLGMSGARILLSAAIELNIRKERYALVTMCVGVGQGYAVVLENMRL
ncbi:MAG: acetyl-CoA C-acyltransferase [Saprospiraceae bacterium]